MPLTSMVRLANVIEKLCPAGPLPITRPACGVTSLDDKASTAPGHTGPGESPRSGLIVSYFGEPGGWVLAMAELDQFPFAPPSYLSNGR